MSAATLENRLRRIMAATFRLDPSEIGLDASADTLAGWDSLSHQNLLLAVSDEFGVTFSAEEGDGLHDFRALRDKVVEKLDVDVARLERDARAAGPSQANAAAQTALGQPVVVIGDSNTRTFAYHSAFLPFTIAQGAKAHLLAAQTRATVEALINLIVARVDANAPVLLYLPGTYMHHFRNTLGTRVQYAEPGADDAFMTEMAGQYVALACRIRDKHARRIAIAAVPPVRSDAYRQGAAAFNAKLQRACQAQGVAFIDVFDDVLDAAQHVKTEFWGDTWHVAPSAARLYIAALENIGFLKPAQGAPFASTYRYFIPTDGGLMDVWGDHPAAELTVEKPETDFDLPTSVTHSQSFRWPRYHVRTNFMEDCLNTLRGALAPWLQQRGQAHTLMVLDCKEGYAAFGWNMPGVREIVGFDHDPARIQRARCLAPFYGAPVTFQHAPRYGEIAATADIAIAFERTAFTDEYYAVLFAKMRAAAKAFAFLSDAAAAHTALLERAGFAEVIELPIVPADGRAHIPQDRKVTGGLRAEQTGVQMLVAFTEKLTPAVRAAISLHVQLEWEKQRDLVKRQLDDHFAKAVTRLARS